MNETIESLDKFEHSPVICLTKKLIVHPADVGAATTLHVLLMG